MKLSDSAYEACNKTLGALLKHSGLQPLSPPLAPPLYKCPSYKEKEMQMYFPISLDQKTTSQR